MTEKKKKQHRPKARLPRGFIDRSPDDIRVANEMVASVAAVYERYGFDPVETPLLEYTDALGKFLPDQDRPNEGVFSLQDDDGKWMSLRYDLTAPLARHVAENFNNIPLPFRTWRAGWVFRNEKSGPGRFRQFMQIDADTVGAPGVQADAEMCMMMADALEALGIARGGYVIRVNNRKVLDGVMEAIGWDGEENDPVRLRVLRAMDKFDRLGTEGIALLLGKGRIDDSGDFTEGADLGEGEIETLIQFLDPGTVSVNRPDISRPEFKNAKGGILWKQPDTLTTNEVSLFDIPSFSEGMRELNVLRKIVESSGYGPDRIRIDPSVVRGLEYYTGPVYEAELLFDVTNEKGEVVRFGSIGGGGRYDGLVSRFMGNPVPATGFSIGVSRLMTALKNLGRLDTSIVPAPILVTVMDGDTAALGRYQKMTQDLRNAGIRAEMYQGNWKKLGNQLKYADRRGCPVAIIQGSDERERGVVQIKDMIEGRRQAEAVASNEEWRERRPGQFEADEAGLVETVQQLLGRHADDRRTGL